MYYGQQPSYGPWNALADMLGAYWKKQSLDGALKYAENVGDQVDKATAPKMVQNPVQPEQYGTQAQQKAIQHLQTTGQMPNPDWLGQNAQQPVDAATRAFMNYVPPAGQQSLIDAAQQKSTVAATPASQQSLIAAAQQQATPSADAVASELAGAQPVAASQPTPAQQSTTAQPAAPATQPAQPKSIMQMLQDFSARDNPNNPTPQQQAVQQQKNAEFAAAKAANPQWYEGNYYVGDDVAARQQAKISQAQQAQQKAAILSQGNNPENGRFSSGMEQYGFTGQKEAPMSYDQHKAAANKVKIQAMRSIISKYGADAAKQAEPLIDAAIADKNTEYADKLDNQNRQELGRYLLNGDINSQKGMQIALWGAEEYNHRAKEMGKPTVDTATLSKMLDSGKVSITAKDVGGSINFYAVPKNGGTFGNDKNGNPIYIRPIMSQGKSMAPKDKASIAISQAKLAEQQRHNVAQESLTARGQNMRAAYASSRSNGGSSRNGGADFNNKKVMSRITDLITAGKSKSEITNMMVNSGMSDDQVNAYWTPSVNDFYHQTQGDDAPE